MLWNFLLALRKNDPDAATIVVALALAGCALLALDAVALW